MAELISDFPNVVERIEPNDPEMRSSRQRVSEPFSTDNELADPALQEVVLERVRARLGCRSDCADEPLGQAEDSGWPSVRSLPVRLEDAPGIEPSQEFAVICPPDEYTFGSGETIYTETVLYIDRLRTYERLAAELGHDCRIVVNEVPTLHGEDGGLGYTAEFQLLLPVERELKFAE